MRLRYIFPLFLFIYLFFEFGILPIPGIKKLQPDIIAHRGDSRRATENTIPALENAILHGADAVELDIRETKDGVLVAMHDKHLRRVTATDCSLKDCQIANVTYEQLSEIKLLGNASVCTLEEALVFSNGNTRLILDLKVSGIEKKVVSLIQKYDLNNSCEITSTNASVLAEIKRLSPQTKVILIVRSARGLFHILSELLPFSSVKNAGFHDGYSIKACYLTASLVRTIRRKEKTVYAWTVNSENELKRMRHLNVDGIITDRLSAAMPDKKPT